MKKIIHITDLHIGYKGCTDNMHLVINKITSTIMSPQEYMIIVTGDIVESPNKNYFLWASQLLNALKDRGFSMLTCPGNHDYVNGGCHGGPGRDECNIRFNHSFNNGRAISYPHCSTDEGIEFIGLDTMLESNLEDSDAVYALGKLGNDQISKLTKQFDVIKADPNRSSHKIVVYMHHNPFRNQNILGGYLLDRQIFLSAIANYNIDVLLFGHDHKVKVRKNSGILRCYDGGSTTRKTEDPDRIMVMDLSRPVAEDYQIEY